MRETVDGTAGDGGETITVGAGATIVGMMTGDGTDHGTTAGGSVGPGTIVGATMTGATDLTGAIVLKVDGSVGIDGAKLIDSNSSGHKP